MQRFKQRREAGFTIVELLIASAVFSIVSLVALTSFIQIGRLFYRGAVYDSNQQAARATVSQLTGDVGAATNISGPFATSGGDSSQCSSSSICYYCVGSARYTFALGKPLSLDAENQERQNQSPSNWSHFALLRDKLTNASDCNNPFATGSTPLASNATELLGNNMRLNQFCISQSQQSQASSGGSLFRTNYGNLFQVIIDVASGDNNVLKLDNLSNPLPCQSDHPAKCNTDLKTAQFCADNSLRTNVAAISPTVTPGPTTTASGGPSATSFTLTVQTSGGTGSLYLDGQLCQGGCSKDYPVDNPEYATVQAIPDYTRYTFSSWSGTNACTQTAVKNGETKTTQLNPCTLKIDTNIGLVAHFAGR